LLPGVIDPQVHILHMSTGEEAELLRREKPAWVAAEVTPQHLLLNTDAYAKIATLAQMNPLLRSPYNNEVLWQALLDGVIDFIADQSLLVIYQVYLSNWACLR